MTGLVSAVAPAELLDEMRPLGPWPDDAHVPTQDVGQLGELVQGGGPEEPADRRKPVVRGGVPLRSRLLFIRWPPAPELERLDADAVAADPFLPEENSASALQAHGDHAGGQHG